MARVLGPMVDRPIETYPTAHQRKLCYMLGGMTAQLQYDHTQQAVQSRWKRIRTLAILAHLVDLHPSTVTTRELYMAYNIPCPLTTYPWEWTEAMLPHAQPNYGNGKEIR